MIVSFVIETLVFAALLLLVGTLFHDFRKLRTDTGFWMASLKMDLDSLARRMNILEQDIAMAGELREQNLVRHPDTD
jgi:hypothetical protein